MAGILKKLEQIERDGFLAEGENFIYSYSSNSGRLFVTSKDGKYDASFAPPYKGVDQAEEFARAFEKSAQIKALRMSGNDTVRITDLVDNRNTPYPAIPERDVPLMFDQIGQLARMSQMIDKMDFIHFAQELATGHPLKGIDISEDDRGNLCFSCATVLRMHEDGINASGETPLAMLENVSAELKEVQRLSAEFMQVTYPPLIEGPAGTLETLAASIRTVDPSLSLNADVSYRQTLDVPLGALTERGRYRLGG